MFTAALTIERNETGPFVVMWMNLESIIQSEVSQKEKNKLRILTYIYGIQKNGTSEPIYRAELETEVENGLVGTRRGGKVGQIKKVAMTYIYHHV